MLQQSEAKVELVDLKEVKVSEITPNPGNPRIHFPEDELARLTESIALHGILVPVVVAPKDGEYVLLDGERRWRAAQRLGHKTIPAVISKMGTEKENLVQMFNIHLVRESWEDMPTAWALEKVIKETGIQTDQELSDVTGLSIERIKRLRHALDLPAQYQRYIDRGEIPLNFFWELKRNVIEPLAKLRPNIWKDYTESKVLKAFVKKRQKNVITDVVSLRQVRPIITFARDEVKNPDDPSVLDKTIRDLIDNEDMTIEDAYEDTVQVIVEADKLQRRTDNMVKSFDRLMKKAHNADERNRIKTIGRSLINRVKALIA